MAKIRNGFVSNSSSSSFIVAFPKDMPITPEAIKEYVFGDQVYITYSDYCIDTLSAADAIYEQMKTQKPNDLEYIKEKCRGWVKGYPEIDTFRIKLSKEIDWDAYSKAVDDNREKFIAQVMTKFEGEDIYAFEFSDNYNEAALEHGGTFDRVPHEQISNH